jgi:hypothetical protein
MVIDAIGLPLKLDTKAARRASTTFDGLAESYTIPSILNTKRGVVTIPLYTLNHYELDMVFATIGLLLKLHAKAAHRASTTFYAFAESRTTPSILNTKREPTSLDNHCVLDMVIVAF